MATGRDAADVAITTSFGRADLKHFYVESNELDEQGESGASARWQTGKNRAACKTSLTAILGV